MNHSWALQPLERVAQIVQAYSQLLVRLIWHGVHHVVARISLGLRLVFCFLNEVVLPFWESKRCVYLSVVIDTWSEWILLIVLDVWQAEIGHKRTMGALLSKVLRSEQTIHVKGRCRPPTMCLGCLEVYRRNQILSFVILWQENVAVDLQILLACLRAMGARPLRRSVN